MKTQITLASLMLLLATQMEAQMEAQKKWSETPKGSFNRIENTGGQT